MEDTYSDFIARAQESVGSQYAKDLLERIRETNIDTDWTNLFSWDLITGIYQEWLRNAGILLGILLLSALFKNLFKNRVIYSVVQQIFLVVIALTLLIPIYQVLQNAQTYMHDISVFLGVLSPTVGTLAASGGNLALAGTSSVFLSIFLSVSEIIINKVVPTVSLVFFVFSIMEVFSGESRIQSLSKWIRNFLFGAFSIATSIFFIIISFQSIAAVNTDTVSSRALRLLVGSAVPIVGGTVGDALRLVGGSLVATKNAVGTAAVVFLLALYLPTLLQTWCSGVMLQLFGVCCEFFGFSEVQGMIGHIKYAIDFSLAAFFCVFVISLLNIGIFMSILPVVIT